MSNVVCSNKIIGAPIGPMIFRMMIQQVIENQDTYIANDADNVLC